MKNRIILILSYIVFIMILQPASAQSGRGRAITGVVTDENNHPIPFATITLLKVADSALVKGAVTDEAGAYIFSDIGPGNYMVSGSVIGMERTYSHSIPVDGAKGRIQAPVIVLKKNVKLLQGVNVTASKPFIQHEMDKTIVNVENSIVSAGNSAWEILQKSPGVAVDNSNNTIQLQGKTGVVIYLDGKPTHLSQDQLANMLKNLNAGSIQSIEIMTQPSAKYDAAGNAGIINIVTRKNKTEGLNGSITAGYTQGTYGRENAGANLNYHNGKVNVYGNYDYAHNKWWNDNYITRNFYDRTGKTLSDRTEQYTYSTYPTNSHNFKVGMDYYVDDKNTIGLMVNGMINPGNGNTQNTTWLKSPDGSLQSRTLTHNTSKDKWTNYTYDLNYKGVFDSTGRELSIDVAYSRFNNRSMQNFRTDTYAPDGSLFPDSPEAPNPNIRKGSLPSDIEIKTAKIDYTLPLKHKSKVAFGAKFSMVGSDNNVQYHQLDNQHQQWQFDSATNHFKYTENINAAYINVNKEFSKGWGLQLGLRGEQTISDGHQFTNDSTVKRNYFQFFPSVYISKKLDKKNTLNLSYSRRVDRPDYQDLNPFRYYLDPYVYQVGNPFLEPQLTHSFSFTYAYESLLTAGVSYSHTTDAMSQVLKQDDSTKITYQTEENLANMQNIGLNITLAIPVTKWWMSNNFINVFRNLYQGEFLGGELNFGRTAYMLNSTNTFTLPKGFSAELSGFYNSRMQWSIFTIRPQYSMSAGIQKKLLHDKANIKLNINDIFKWQTSFASVKYQNLDVTANNGWDSRTVNVTFTYNFSTGEVKPVKHHQSAIEEEQNRIKK